jgi:chromosome partitioning protein
LNTPVASAKDFASGGYIGCLMPVVTVASPKGGSGKSTASVILAAELAYVGAEVVVLDCDPNRSITIWSSRGILPPRVAVKSDVGESEIVRTIKQQDADGRIVIVDLEGVASRWCRAQYRSILC